MSQKITADQIKALRGLPARQFKRAVLEILDRARKSETPGSGPGASGDCDGEDRTSPARDRDQLTHPRQAGQVSAAGREVNPGGVASPWSPSRTRAREARASLSLSDDSKKASEREEESLPRAWREAAERERQRAGLPAVRLEVEYAKAVAWYADKGRELRLGSWLVWALRAWLDKGNTPIAESKSHAASAAPKAGQPPAGIDETDWRHIRGWAQPAPGRRPFWAEPWGPPPDHPNCTLPPAAVARALALRSSHLAGLTT